MFSHKSARGPLLDVAATWVHLVVGGDNFCLIDKDVCKLYTIMQNILCQRGRLYFFLAPTRNYFIACEVTFFYKLRNTVLKVFINVFLYLKVDDKNHLIQANMRDFISFRSDLRSEKQV